MGGKSSSSSSSSTTTTQVDQRIAATDNANVIKDVGGSITISTADPEILQAGFNYAETLASQSLALADNGLDKSYEFAEKVSEFLKDQNTSFLNALSTTQNKAYEFVDKQGQDEQGRSINWLVPWLTAGAAIVAISQGFKK